MMGRTHSVHAEPTTFGLKLAGWAFELDRDRERLRAAMAGLAVGKISGPVGTYSHLEPDVERGGAGRAGARAGAGQHADRGARPARRVPDRRWPSPAAPSSASPPRCATSSTPRSARSWSRSGPARRARARCPTSATPSSPSASSGMARLLRGYAHAGPGGPGPVARAGHQPQLGRAGRPARRDVPARLHAGALHGPGPRPRRAARADAPEPGPRPRAARQRPRPGGPRRGGRPEPRGGLRRSSSGTPCARPTRSARWRSRWPAIRPSRPRCSEAALAACFDDDAHLRHVPEVLARLDALLARPGGDPWCSLKSFVRAGKVRDLYSVDDRRLLLVASDRISAFDVVLPTPIPDKGRVLTGLSRFWFARDRAAWSPTTSWATDVTTLPAEFADAADELRGRSMICRRARVLPVECIVRGYLSGSGWKDYQRVGRRVRHPAAGRPARERPPARAALHALHQGRGGPRREHRLGPHGRAHRPRADRAREPDRAGALRLRGGPRRVERASSWPTRSSSSGSTTRAASCSSSTRS